MDFFANPICCLYLTGHMIRISSFPGPVLNSFPGGPCWRFVGVRPFSFGIGLCTSPCLTYLLLFCVLLLAFYRLWPSLSQLMHSLMPFAILTPRHLRPKCLTYRLFLVRLRECLSMLGYSPSSYAGHSFRRGGASFAFESGIPIELIKMLGDWKSNSVLLYLTAPLKVRLNTTNLITKSIIRLIQ